MFYEIEISNVLEAGFFGEMHNTAWFFRFFQNFGKRLYCVHFRTCGGIIHNSLPILYR